jgi:hypothetical protein
LILIYTRRARPRARFDAILSPSLPLSHPIVVRHDEHPPPALPAPLASFPVVVARHPSRLRARGRARRV